MSKKGQLAILDLFIALLVFIILVSSIIFTWNKYNVRLENRLNYNEMMIKAFHVSDLLIKSSGKKTAWEKDSNVSIIGLAYNDRNLSKEKVDAFIKLDNNKIKQLLTIKNNFYFQLKYVNGSSITEKGLIFSKEVGASAVNVKRYVTFENERAIMEFTIWA